MSIRSAEKRCGKSRLLGLLARVAFNASPVTVLNVGFERGGVVTRLEHRGDRLVEVPYEVFAPRVLAGIENLKETLEDRALPLTCAASWRRAV